MQKFYTFLDKKHRKALKELKIVSEILKLGGLNVINVFEDQFDPSIFVAANEVVPFGGVRVYKLANTIAYRAQNDPNSHPFGTAYELPIEKMFEDYLDENDIGDKIGGVVAKAIVDEIKYFFKKNAEVYHEPPRDGVNPLIMTPPVSAADNFRANGPWP